MRITMTSPNCLYPQDAFTKKVLSQKDDIDLVAATAVGATENIRDGNEELRKAIQNQVRYYRHQGRGKVA